MQNYTILTDESDRELIQHGSVDFPCAGYDESFSKFLLGEVPWHWHEEIEIVLVYAGATRVEYFGGTCDLDCGQGIFINAGAAHRLTQIGETDCKILNFVLDPEMLGGPRESRLYREYISPICSNKSLCALKLTPESVWQKRALEQFSRAFDAYTHGKRGYEMETTLRLMEFWRLIYVNRPDLLEQIGDLTTDERRIRTILEFIERNYAVRASVDQLASHAGISESECYRLFRRLLKCSPNDYLLKYRLKNASAALLSGDDTVQEIAMNCGFNSSAYFAKKFKAAFGRTPMEFRKESR